MKVAVMASGGMDSTVLIYDLLNKGYECVPLFFDYGQKCNETELNALKRVLPGGLSERIKVINLRDIYAESNSLMIRPVDPWTEHVESEDLYLPYRNILLLAAAAAWAFSSKIGEVYSAFINSNHAKEIDCTERFLGDAEKIFLDYGGVKLKMPYRHLSKFEVASLGIELGAPIGATFSCQLFGDIPCGACPNCVDRLAALEKLQDEVSN